MLLELHVKNLALIEKADVEFGEGLNILTGETGAGKSIIIGSVTMALGGKASRESIRHGADYAYIELVFSVSGQEKTEALKALEVEPTEDGLVIVSRKIMPSRSVSRINDETVTTARLRQITGLLLDIHGQHEHQSLLYKSKHLEILDAYIKAGTQPVKQKIADGYQSYRALVQRLEEFDMDSESRIREADFLRFEIQEIEEAGLKDGEEEELTAVYRRFSHSQKIAASLGEAYNAVEGEWLPRALKEVEQVVEFDHALDNIRDQLYDADSILEDAKREISSYMSSMEFDEETFRQTEERLDLIHNLQAKYGATISKINQKLEEKRKRLDELEDYDYHREQTKKELDERFVLIYTGQRRLARNLLRDVVGRYVGNEPDSLFALEEIQKTAVLIDCCTIILIPVSLKCGDTGVIYRLSFLSIRQRLSRWRLIRSRNTIVERTEEIPSATGSAKKAAFAPKKEGRTAALITKRDFLVTESASPVFGHSRAVSPSTKTYWKLSGMIISV